MTCPLYVDRPAVVGPHAPAPPPPAFPLSTLVPSRVSAKLQLVTRRELLQLFSALAAGSVAARYPLAFGQTAPAALLTPLGEGLSLLSGIGGNITILKADSGLLMVDSGLPDATGQLTEKAGTIGAPVKVLINTHWHYDHTGGNVVLGAAGARIIAHAKTAQRLQQKITIAFMNRSFDPPAAAGQPKETFSSEGKLNFGHETVRYKYFPPAHTDGDTTVRYDRAGVYQTGDLFFNGAYPFIDYSTGGSIEGMIHNAAAMLKQVDANTKIVPGHGPLGTKADLQRFHDVLSDAEERISKLQKAGKTVDEAIAAEPTRKYDDTWGKGFISGPTFVKLIYAGRAESVKGKAA